MRRRERFLIAVQLVIGPRGVWKYRYLAILHDEALKLALLGEWREEFHFPSGVSSQYHSCPFLDCNRALFDHLCELEPGDATSLWAVDPLQALETRAELLQALGQLHERQRAVLVLRYFNDLTEAQVADVLGCSPGTVKSSASRGLARLREALQPVPLQPRSTET